MRTHLALLALLALPAAAISGQGVGSISIGPPHLRSGFAARITATAGKPSTRLGLELGASGNALGPLFRVKAAPESKRKQEVVHVGLLLEHRPVRRIPLELTALFGGFAVVTGLENLHVCRDAPYAKCSSGSGPFAYSWLSSAGYALGVAGVVPAGPVSLRAEVRQYSTGMPTVGRFTLVDVGVARSSRR